MFLPSISVVTRNPLQSIGSLNPLFQGQKPEGKGPSQPSPSPASGDENFKKKKFWWGILPLTLASIFSPVATIVTYKAINPTPSVVQLQQNELESLELKTEYLNEFYVKAQQQGTLENAYMEWVRAYKNKADYVGNVAHLLINYNSMFRTDQASSLMKAPSIQQLHKYAQKVSDLFNVDDLSLSFFPASRDSFIFNADDLSLSFFPETRASFKVYLSLAEKLSPEIQKWLENEPQDSFLRAENHLERISSSEAAFKKVQGKLAMAVKGDLQKQKALQEMNQIFWQLPLNF